MNLWGMEFLYYSSGVYGAVLVGEQSACIGLSAQIRGIRGDKPSELVPHSQIDKSLDAGARLEAAEPMVSASFQPEGGQLEGGKDRSMVFLWRK